MSASLVDYWREQLAANEQAMGEADGRFVWLNAAYARVFRFLLSIYGATEPPPSEVEPEGTAGDELPEPWQGKRAKSAEQIRQAVTAIHATHGNPPLVGPLAGGLNDGDWVLLSRHLVESFATVAAKKLQAEGIPARVYHRQGDWCVEVRLEDRLRARQRLGGSLDSPPLLERPESPRGVRINSQFVSFVLFMLVFGAVAGVFAIAVTFETNPAVAITLISIGGGLALLIELVLWIGSFWRSRGVERYEPTSPAPPLESQTTLSDNGQTPNDPPRE